MKKLLTILLGTVLMCSCGKKTLLDEERSFANATWNRFTPEVYTVEVENPDEYYNIDLEVVVDTAEMRGNQLPLTVNLYSPEGERRMFYSGVELVEHERWKGERVEGNAGQRKVKQQIRSFFTFNRKGAHRMEIGQATSQYDLTGVYTLRVRIEKAEIDYESL